MKAIIVSQGTLDNLFRGLLEHEYGYDHFFMHNNEIHEEFKKTTRYRMLQGFRQHLTALKQDIEKSQLP